MSVSVATHMGLHWGRIAIENAELARQARTVLEDLQGRGDGRLPMDTELQPALVAVSAAARALDALYAELKPLVVPVATAEVWKKNRTPRKQQIRETLKLGFTIGGDQWREDLDWLFDLRDAAVHPSFSFIDPHAHPLGLHAAREYSIFTCEQAERAARLDVEIYSVCVERPRAATANWAKQMRASAESLRALLPDV